MPTHVTVQVTVKMQACALTYPSLACVANILCQPKTIVLTYFIMKCTHAFLHHFFDMLVTQDSYAAIVTSFEYLNLSKY